MASLDPTFNHAITGLIGLLIAGFVAWCFFRGFEWLARRRLRSLYQGLDLRTVPERGDVQFSYVTFHGLIAWYTPMVHVACGPADQALRLLGRLFRFNLMWGLLTFGTPLYVYGVFAYYRRARRSIVEQAAAGGFDPDEAATTEADPSGDASLPGRSPFSDPSDETLDELPLSDNPYAPPRAIPSVVPSDQPTPPPQQPSLVLRICGGVSFVLGLLVVAVAIVNLFRSDFGPAFAGLTMGVFLWAMGYGWLKNGS